MQEAEEKEVSTLAYHYTHIIMSAVYKGARLVHMQPPDGKTHVCVCEYVRVWAQFDDASSRVFCRGDRRRRSTVLE